MSETTDPNHEGVNKPKGKGEQNEAYLVLSEEERAKGFIRPLYSAYIHVGKKLDTERMMAVDEYWDLNPKVYDEERRKYYKKLGYKFFIPATEEETKKSAVIGTYITEKMLETGCNTSTKINSQGIIETYARDPKFYGSTWCTCCKAHVPNDECVWVGSDGVRVGE